MNKKSVAITLVLVSGLLSSCADKPQGKYQMSYADSMDNQGRVYVVPRYYWIPVSGTPIQVTPTEFETNEGAITRGGFGSTGEAHASEAAEGAHGGVGE